MLREEISASKFPVSQNGELSELSRDQFGVAQAMCSATRARVRAGFLITAATLAIWPFIARRAQHNRTRDTVLMAYRTVAMTRTEQQGNRKLRRRRARRQGHVRRLARCSRRGAPRSQAWRTRPMRRRDAKQTRCGVAWDVDQSVAWYELGLTRHRHSITISPSACRVRHSAVPRLFPSARPHRGQPGRRRSAKHR